MKKRNLHDSPDYWVGAAEAATENAEQLAGLAAAVQFAAERAARHAQGFALLAERFRASQSDAPEEPDNRA